MLNKKTIFNFVYAMALVGAVLSCVGILNEFLNIAQLKGFHIRNDVATLTGDDYYKPFFFYLVAFIVSALALTLLLLRLFAGQKSFHVAANLLALAACIVLIVLSFVFLADEFQQLSPGYGYDYWISYFDYLIYYTFRTGIMSFVANAGVILVCNLLDAKHQKAQDNVPIEE